MSETSPPPTAVADPNTTFEQIDFDVHDHIATITLNRPDRMNAVTDLMVGEITSAFDRVDADDDIRVVVVTGAGRAFCAGADLQKEGADGGGAFEFANPQEHRDLGGDVALRILDCTRPVIGAINGAAVGMGATMLLPMDFRLAATTAKLGFVFTRRGITPDGAATWFLPRTVGINRALDWLITGRVFPAAEAAEAGLVNSVHEGPDLLSAAYAVASDIALNTSPVCVAMTRQMTWRMLGAEHPRTAHELESRSLGVVGRAADALEGAASFLDKRPPAFPGRISRDMPDFYPWWPARPFTPVP
jgi:enoyl-CoA hydratase/carnithine racemase